MMAHLLGPGFLMNFLCQSSRRGGEGMKGDCFAYCLLACMYVMSHVMTL